MSLKYFARYRFDNSLFPGQEDFGERGLAVESGAAVTAEDAIYGQTLSLQETSLVATGAFDLIANDNSRAISFWANTFNTNSPAFSVGSMQGPDGFTFYTMNNSGSPEFYDHTTRHTATDVLNENTWYHYVIGYDASVQLLSVFVDGALIYSQSVGPLSTGSSEALRIGTDGEGQFFNGIMLDFRMWDFSLSAEVVEYISMRGPNYAEALDRAYLSNTLRTDTVAGKLMCKSNLGVKPTGDVLLDSFYGHDSNLDVLEAARVEYSQSASGNGALHVKVRHDGYSGAEMAPTVEITPEKTTFFSRDVTDDTTSSVVFSSAGVTLVPSSASSEKGCLIFGKGADFRIRVKDGLFTIESYHSATDSYVTKMEIQ
ncbi:unnamed protein product [Ectocarpus sp. 6 AP-2014]